MGSCDSLLFKPKCTSKDILALCLLCSLRTHDQIPLGNRARVNAQELVHREQSFLEEHILEGSACGWVHRVHSKKPNKCFQVAALGQVLSYAPGDGKWPGCHFLSVCSKRCGRDLESVPARVARLR